MSVKSRIEKKLADAFHPADFQVIDESYLHAGHAGSRPEGESHFRIHLTAPAFAGKSRVERHRMVHSALAEELDEGVHALALDLSAPGERPDGRA